MWASIDETPGNTGTGNTTYNGTSFSIDGSYIAGAGGVKIGNMASKGIKLRTGATDNIIVLKVNEGYRIDGIKIYGCTNSSSTTNVVSVTVDGGENLLESTVTLPKKTDTSSGDIVLSNIAATDNITLHFPSGSSNQIVLDIHVSYTQTQVITKTITGVSLNGTAISETDLATLKSTKNLTIDGSSLNGCGALDVTLSSGSTTVAKAISNGTATYTFSVANSPVENYTVTVNNLSKTYTKAGKVLAYKEDDTSATGTDTYTVTLNNITATFVDNSKNFNKGDCSVTLGSNKYLPLKLSTGSAFNITFPDGYVATKVTVYGFSQSGNGKLTSFKETESGEKSVDVSNDVYYATATSTDIYPSVYTYNLDNWTSVYATGAGSASQPYVVMDFILVPSVTLNDKGYSTFSSANEYSISGAEAYTGKVDEDAKTITWTKIADGIIPANEGVLLKGTASATVTLAASATSKAKITDNQLKANLTAMTNTADSHIYVLSGENFMLLASNGTLAANKAYFQLSQDVTSASAAKEFTVIWDDATAVNTVKAASSKSGIAYNLAGQRVNANAKGIVIMNGKKFINK